MQNESNAEIIIADFIFVSGATRAIDLECRRRETVKINKVKDKK